MRLAVVADRIGWEERQVMLAARERGIDAFWVNDSDLCLGPAAVGAPDADVFFMRSRSYARCGIVAGLLGDGGTRVVNSATSIGICQDKVTTARALGAAGLPVLDFRVVLSQQDLAQAIDEFGMPCVIKPVLGGLGRRVLLVRERDLAAAAYQYVEHFGTGFDRVLIAQPYHRGQDERVIVVGSEVVAAYRRIPDGDWRANVAAGATVAAADATSETQFLCHEVTRVTGAEVYALDLFVDDGGHKVVNEVNHVPLFRGAAAATGVSIGVAIAAYLERVLAGDVELIGTR
jgi:[lysine-biosynthesis-protein LysW]---L-2-aminoadipate ligase